MTVTESGSLDSGTTRPVPPPRVGDRGQRAVGPPRDRVDAPDRVVLRRALDDRVPDLLAGRRDPGRIEAVRARAGSCRESPAGGNAAPRPRPAERLAGAAGSRGAPGSSSSESSSLPASPRRTRCGRRRPRSTGTSRTACACRARPRWPLPGRARRCWAVPAAWRSRPSRCSRGTRAPARSRVAEGVVERRRHRDGPSRGVHHGEVRRRGLLALRHAKSRRRRRAPRIDGRGERLQPRRVGQEPSGRGERPDPPDSGCGRGRRASRSRPADARRRRRAVEFLEADESREHRHLGQHGAGEGAGVVRTSTSRNRKADGLADLGLVAREVASGDQPAVALPVRPRSGGRRGPGRSRPRRGRGWLRECARDRAA